MMIVSVEPKFGDNYCIGYSGFTYRPGNMVSKGIAYFTRWNRMREIRVSHVFIVSGEDERIDAQMEDGVQRRGLQELFAEPGILVFFRKPKDFSLEIGSRIAASAAKLVGAKYDKNLMKAHALAGTLGGRLFGRLVKRLADRELIEVLADVFDDPTTYICSEAAAFAMDDQPEYHDKGILALCDAAISPQRLFEDDVIYEEWKNRVRRLPDHTLTGDKK